MFIFLFKIYLTLLFFAWQISGPFLYADKPPAFVSAPEPSSLTNYEKQLKRPYRFYFLRLKHKDNFFSFNVPEESFLKLSSEGKDRLVESLLTLYDRAFSAFKEIFASTPRGYQFNITFGETSSGSAFNKVYPALRRSNIFPGFIPHEKDKDDFTGEEKEIIMHEIGHSLFAIMVGTLAHPRTKAVEEGFVDYIALGGTEAGKRGKIQVSRRAISGMNGLTQLDIDTSIWPEEAVLKLKDRGYIGITHHLFGLEFINSFLEVLGAEKLPEFLKRLKAIETTPPESDFGTSQVKHILNGMGYSDEKVQEFETNLHKRLLENVFEIKSEL